MQQTALPRSDTARRTGHGVQLFCRQVTLPHFDTLRQNQPQNCSILNAMRTIGTWRAYPTTVGNRRVAAPQSPKPPRGGHPLCGFGRKFELSTVNSLPPNPSANVGQPFLVVLATRHSPVPPPFRRPHRDSAILSSTWDPT